MKNLHNKLMEMGRAGGCHQIPERSFFWKGYQFPICARCTGVFIGQTLAIPIYFLVKLPAIVYVILCAVMFLDWMVQHLKICESTNIRRLITGIMGGFGLFSVYIITIIFFINKFGILEVHL